MLRVVLALTLVAFIGGIGYYLGRSSTPVVSTTTTPFTAPVDQVRSRTQPPPALPAPPPVTPDTDTGKTPALPNTVEGQVPGDASVLTGRTLGSPIDGLKSSDIQDTFAQARGGGERRHEASDILAPRGTPVIAVEDGIIAKLFTSQPGGLTVYQFDPSQKYAYYYAHLDRYVPGLREGMPIRKGGVIGYVGTTGNSDPNTPHLHFAIFELGPEKHWWQGKPINPYPFLMQAVGH